LTINGTTMTDRFGLPVVGWLRSSTAAVPRSPVLVTDAGEADPAVNATAYGGMEGTHLFRPVVGAAATATGKGYWEAASDGGIFTLGDAQFYGSTGGHVLNQPVVGMAATADGKGYWLVAADGGIITFGDAQFYGSMGGKAVPGPIVGIAATGDGLGYWMATQGGTLYAFGSAPYYANTGRVAIRAGSVVGMTLTSDR